MADQMLIVGGPQNGADEQDTLRIGAYDWQVVHDDVLVDGAYGEMNYMRQEIRISHDLNETMARSVLWHEAVHVILSNAGFNEQDEQLVEVIAHGIAQILRDNPWMGQAV